MKLSDSKSFMIRSINPGNILFHSELERTLETITDAREKILENAFKKHFGYPFSEVKDTATLVRKIIPGDPIEQYQYAGETFLLMEREEHYEEVQEGNVLTFKGSFRYMEV